MRKEKNDRVTYMKLKKIEKLRRKYGKLGYWELFSAASYQKEKLKSQYLKSAEGKFKTAQIEAQQKKLDFKMGKNEFKALTEKDCIFCGAKAPNQVIRNDVKVGFVLHNLLTACNLCKEMKGSLNLSTFITQVARIYENEE